MTLYGTNRTGIREYNYLDDVRPCAVMRWRYHRRRTSCEFTPASWVKFIVLSLRLVGLRRQSNRTSLGRYSSHRLHFLPLLPVIDDAPVLSLDLRSKSDRRSLLKRRSPINPRSSSDRVSTPLRRSFPDRRPSPDRLSLLFISRLHWFLHNSNGC